MQFHLQFHSIREKKHLSYLFLFEDDCRGTFLLFWVWTFMTMLDCKQSCSNCLYLSPILIPLIF